MSRLLHFNVTGKIHQAAHVCPEDLIEELKFWQLNPECAESTCTCTQEIVDNDSELESILDDESEMDDEFRDVRFGDLRVSLLLLCILYFT
jgi:hypothetical protein